MNDPNRHSSERESRHRFDMIVTFTDEAQARRALADLRDAGFGPDQALLLQPEDTSASLIAPGGQISLSTPDLLADRAAAIWIIICTEFVVGALAGALVGWIVALFLNAPNIGPVWTWMLILGALGAGAGIALGALEWRKWQRQLETLPQQIAIGMRFGGRAPADEMARARPILERYGGSGINNA
jgi:hypothetical protein